MNPGLLNQLVSIHRQTSEVDELGQPQEQWVSVARFFARRKAGKAKAEQVVADREREGRTMVFQVRSRPFVTVYREGDRLVESKRVDFPETAWTIIGWAEVEGTAGMYLEVYVESLRCP